MEWQIALVIIAVAFLVLLILGIPLAAAMGIVGAVYILVLQGSRIGMGAIALQTLKGFISYDLLAIAFYVLIGELMLVGGLAADMFEFASKWLQRIPGGLAIVAIACGTIFATCSGSSTASTSTIGKISIPQMLERGYSKRLAVGAVAAAGGLAHLIPPSILMVVYASFNELPVGQMLMAGVIPGLLVATGYAAVALTWGVRHPESAPRETAASWKERFLVLRKMIGPLLIVFSVIGTIILGIATVTEASVMGSIMAVIPVIIRKKFSMKSFSEVLHQTVLTTSFIVFIMIGAKLFSWVLSYFMIPQHIVEWVATFSVSPIMLIIMFQVLYFILGMFLDTIGQIFITMPIILPILLNLGFSPIWFGVMFFINVEMGMITPPYGIILYVLKGIAPPQVSINDIVWGSAPFFVADISAIALIMAFPAIALWLPGVIFGG